MRIDSKRSWWADLLGVVGAGLLLGSAGVHLDLYLTGYRRIPTIGSLFLLQAAGAIVLAIGVLVASRLTERAGVAPLTRAAAVVFALGTIAAYALSRAIGLFGFHEQPTLAGLVAGLLELGAFVAVGSQLVATAGTGRSTPADGPGSPGATRAVVVRRLPSLGLALLSAALLTTLLVSGIGGASASSKSGPRANGSTAMQSRQESPRSAPAPVVHVVISNYTYHPDRVEVRPGETIAVTNDDEVTHTMTAVPGSMPFGGFDTGYVDPGRTVRIRAPRTPGTYDFYCSIHHFMTGELVVSKQG